MKYICPYSRREVTEKTYRRKWQTIIDNVQAETGCRVVGYDPGVLIIMNKNTMSLPMWFIKQMGWM